MFLRFMLMAVLSLWLVPEPALAYFSKEVQLQDLGYKVFAHIDAACQHPLQENSLAALQERLENSKFERFRGFRGCFAAVFDVEVRKRGSYSFIHNGYVKKIAIVNEGQYAEVSGYYENDSIVADLDLLPGHYRIYSSGYSNMAPNRWGIGNAAYMVKSSSDYHRSSFLIGSVRGICLGILSIMAVFFLFMTRESNRVFLIYGTFILCNILFIESIRSLVGELLGLRGWVHYYSEWNLIAQVLGTSCQLLMGLYFAAFYDIKNLYPRFHRFFVFMYGLILLEIPVSFLKLPYGYIYGAGVMLTGTLTMVGIAVWFSITRGGLYHLVLVGYVAMLSFAQYFVLTIVGVVEVQSIWGRDVHLLGSTIEVILFSIATSLKLNNKFAQQKKANDHVLEQLQKIIYPHQLQKIREGSSLEETMPTGKAEACVLSFDIIGSSRIQHDKVKDFVERAIELCISNMYERYEASSLSADAYRIKVLGDGFLCSIGFPFNTPPGESVEDAAVQLAIRMVKTFKRVEKEFAYHEPIFCAIGLAYGAIEAYYPQIGTREYDLYGSAIVLATRYEQLRKQLFSPESADYIILQERVYERLRPELRNHFECIDLEKRQIRVRDDDQAHRVYIWQNSNMGVKQIVA